MDAMLIEGGVPLKGELAISGAKNAALPIMMAATLIPGKTQLQQVPNLRDVHTTCRLLGHLGCDVSALSAGALSIDATDMASQEVPYDWVKTMRASVLLLGPLLARRGLARVSLPGGCAIGARPINFHLDGLAKMGAQIELESGYVVAKAKRLTGAAIRFPDKTVTGTENLMMAAALAQGETVLQNAAREPEVVDLAQFLKAAGVTIEGAGTETIRVQGTSQLQPVDYAIMGDRIEMGTLMIAAAITQGDLLLKNFSVEHMRAVIDKLKEAGVSIEKENASIRVKATDRPQPVDLTTQPYPGFPTDMQAQFMSLMTVAQGKSVITETIFENRFMHVSELSRLGASIRTDGHSAIIDGKAYLEGARIMATDLRASASLVLAGLCARGQTRLSRVYHLDRGYEHLEKKLAAVGARIERISERFP